MIVSMRIASFCLVVRSELFDAVAHPDCLLRGGVEESLLYEQFLPILEEFSGRGLCYELNGSGFTKPSYDREQNRIRHGKRTFPSRLIMRELKIIVEGI